MEPNTNLPQIGDAAPAFEAMTNKGPVAFPGHFGDGNWTIFFAHPANFTGAWVMYSTFLALKEKYFTDRNCKLLGLFSQPNVPDAEGTWAEKARRYLGIYLKAPVVDDADLKIAGIYGMVIGRLRQSGHDRVAYVIDPGGIIRGIISGPFTLQSVVDDLEKTINRLQGINEPEPLPIDPKSLIEMQEKADQVHSGFYKTKPAYFPKKELGAN